MSPCRRLIAIPQHQLASTLSKEKPDWIVSITDPGASNPVALDSFPHPDRIVRLAYTVHERGHDSVWFNHRHAAALKQGALTHGLDNVLVHCGAGQMRSPAVTLFFRLLKAERNGVNLSQSTHAKNIFDAWLRDHPNAIPHERTLWMCLDTLEHDEIAILLPRWLSQHSLTA